MAILFMDGFDHYGSGQDGRLKMLDGVWAELAGLNTSPVVPSFGARTGTHALQIPSASGTAGDPARLVIPGGVKDQIWVAHAHYSEQLPQANDTRKMVEFRTAGNVIIGDARLNADGSISVTDVNGTLVSTSAGPVIQAGAWNHVEVRCRRSTGDLEVRVNEVQVINASGANLGPDPIGQIRFRINSAGSDITDFFVDDLVVSDDQGTYNTGFNGDLRVATTFPNADTATSGWEAYPRQKFGTGVLDLPDGDSALAITDNAVLNIGAGDFTYECFGRFDALPAGSDYAVIAGQWNEPNDQRSWQLYKGGPSLAAGATVFRISTDGTAGTVSTLISWPNWFPEIGRYYHIAVSRVSGTLYLFIDGQLQGVGVADANTYHDSTDELLLGGQSTAGSGVENGTGWTGTFDETRFTVGVGRYSANFAPPTAAFPRSAPADPDFASVAFLAGYDNDLSDESSNSLTTTARGGAVALQPDDGDAKYKVVDDAAPDDTTYLAADFLFATGILTLTANPADTETVTVGSTTYTFNTVLGGANSVLIGASADDSLSNLAAAINAGAGSGTVYGIGTVQNPDAGATALGGQQMQAVASTQGAAGNTVATTETLANGSWDNATLTGGADIPGPIDLEFGSLPPLTTQVRAIQYFTRARKSDADSCNIQPAYVVNASVGLGTDRPITTADTYYLDVFEEDPSTAAGLTVNSFVAGQVRQNRTV